MHLVVFEASKWDTFAPVTINRPVFSLLCGMSSLLDKQIRYTSAFGDAARQYLHLPGMASFARPVTVTARDGFALHMFEVDRARLARFAACRPPPRLAP